MYVSLRIGVTPFVTASLRAMTRLVMPPRLRLPPPLVPTYCALIHVAKCTRWHYHQLSVYIQQTICITENEQGLDTLLFKALLWIEGLASGVCYPQSMQKIIGTANP